MNVKVKGVHVRLSSGLREYLDKHLVEPLSRLYPDDSATLTVHLVDVNGPKGGLDKEVRVTLHTAGKIRLHVSERGEDLGACICVARDRIQEAAKRVRAKRMTKRIRAEAPSLSL